MQASLDRAVGDGDALGVEAGDITYAALLDRHASEEPITDDMIRHACLRLESASAGPLSPSTSVESPAGTLARLFRVRR